MSTSMNIYSRVCISKTQTVEGKRNIDLILHVKITISTVSNLSNEELLLSVEKLTEMQHEVQQIIFT